MKNDIIGDKRKNEIIAIISINLGSLYMRKGLYDMAH